MTRESVSPFDDDHRGGSLRRSRSHHPFSSYLSEARSSRTSVISSALPYLRRLDITDDMSAQSKNPLLTLSLSSPSFLDSKVQDDMSSYALYTIKTEGTVTTISRSDKWGDILKTAVIKWPKHISSKGKGGKGKGTEEVELQIRGGRMKSADDFLSSATMLSAPRRFKIPGYSHALKWKAVGSSFLCFAASAKGPIAILEPAVDAAPPRLKVFETLHDKYDARPMAVHQGVSVLLLDYLLVSALLLVTDIQEWTMVRPSSAQGASGSSPNTGPASASMSSASTLQWRKIMFGEPIYKKRLSTASRQSSSQVPPTPTSADQMAKIMLGKPIYPTLQRRASSSDSSFLDDDSEDDLSDSDSDVKTDAEEHSEEVIGVKVARTSQRPSRPPSPSAESVFYPLTTTTAPSHTYLDPMFYNEHNIPPVPKIPARYASSSNSSRIPSPVTPGPAIHNSRRFRELPRPPSHRSQSTPRPRTADGSLSSPVESTVSSVSDYRRPSYDASFLVSPTSYTRTLPVPPPQSPIEPLRPALPLRHSQSSGRPLNSRYRDKRVSQYSQRTLPPTPMQERRNTSKRCFGDLTDWLSSPEEAWPGPQPSTSRTRPESILSVDCPPPAYNSIEFNSGTTIPSTWPVSSLPPPASSPETNI
ncbi:hypothetical protein WG66_001267 [Moniliophthora roreri]|nr:hypothetical protein WG66_001267 [Moniliophthora roreri]